jgi:hypothetical protein
MEGAGVADSAPVVVVPRELRLDWRARWRAANVLARRQGTPLARAIAPWCWLAAGLWFLGLTMTWADTAGIGRACFTTRIITKHQLVFRVALYRGAAKVSAKGAMS